MRLRSCVAALGLAAALAVPHARATNVSTDVTDIWWPDAEPGWGIQLIQNAGVIFATMFMFGAENEPIFVVAVLDKQPGVDVWTGGVYGAEGTWYALPWDPADRFEAQVGTMTFTLANAASGTLAYTIGTFSTTKTISRQPLVLENNTGNYRITHTWTPTGPGCTAADAYSPAAGPVSGDLSIVNVNPEIATVSLTWQHVPLDVCSMTASYAQGGRIGTYGGALTCPTSGKSGQLVFYEVANAVGTLTGRYVMEWSYGCTRNGRFTAISPNP
ncbi:MAG: hypothetical protein ACHQJ7_06485 [Vicinamibacteria bacterium]|jgi:hypothetical protein